MLRQTPSIKMRGKMVRPQTPIFGPKTGVWQRNFPHSSHRHNRSLHGRPCPHEANRQTHLVTREGSGFGVSWARAWPDSRVASLRRQASWYLLPAAAPCTWVIQSTNHTLEGRFLQGNRRIFARSTLRPHLRQA